MFKRVLGILGASAGAAWHTYTFLHYRDELKESDGDTKDDIVDFVVCILSGTAAIILTAVVMKEARKF